MATKPAYSFKPNFFKAISAQVAGEEIERIRNDRGEFFQPDDLVDEGRPDDAPLHPAFEWDDEKAAEEHRKHQARQLISHIVVVDDEKPAEQHVRAFVSVPTTVGPRYTSTIYSISVPELRQGVIAQYLNAIEALRSNLEKYTELAEVTDHLQKAATKLRRKRLEMA